jgi:hypothetical protein
VAEIGVADRIFAQHYVAPLALTLKSPAKVYAWPSTQSEIVASLASGEIFHLVDLGHDWAWGRGDALGSVGYLPAVDLDLS